MSPLKQSALVAKLKGNLSDKVKVIERIRTTFPGLRFDLLHVEVSVVQQLKQRRRTRSLNFVAASSV